MISFRQYLSEVNIDNKKGWGSVPYNQEVDYMGLRVKMKPSMFLKLAAKTSSDVSDEMKSHIKSGGSIGAPFLQFRIPEDFKEPPTVIGHEGRHRMMAIQQIEGDRPIEVHIFISGFISRARHINKETETYMKKSSFKQNTRDLIKGPLWK